MKKKTFKYYVLLLFIMVTMLVLCRGENKYNSVIDKHVNIHNMYIIHSYEDRHTFKNDGQIDRHIHKYGWKWKVYLLCMLMRKQI